MAAEAPRREGSIPSHHHMPANDKTLEGPFPTPSGCHRPRTTPGKTEDN